MYDIWMAEGVTLSSQAALDSSYASINNYVNRLLKTPNMDRVIASDTDSVYFDFTEVTKKFAGSNDPVDFLDKMCDTVIKKKLDEGFNDLAEKTNAFVNRMNMKRESIGTAVFVAKKNYTALVYDNEGVRYATPKLKVTGLESIKSTTPVYFRSKLEDCYALAFQSDETKFHKLVENIYEGYMRLPVEEIASSTSVTSLDKYIDGEGYVSGAPANSKAAIAYNRFIKKHNLLDKYKPIQGGDKIKMVKLKTPNPYGLAAIAYLDQIPTEMDLERWVDKQMLYEKFFLKPVMRVFTQLRWNYESRSSVDELFG